MAKDKSSSIKKEIEKGLIALLKDNAEPSEGRMKLLKLGIGYLAVNNKLEEDTYGGFFADDEPGNAGSVQKRPDGEEPDAGGRAKRRRSNGAGRPDSEGASPGSEGT